MTTFNIHQLSHCNAGFDKENRFYGKISRERENCIDILRESLALIYHWINQIFHLLLFQCYAQAHTWPSAKYVPAHHHHPSLLRRMMKTMVPIKYLKITFIFIHRLNWINFHWLWFFPFRCRVSFVRGVQ